MLHDNTLPADGACARMTANISVSISYSTTSGQVQHWLHEHSMTCQLPVEGWELCTALATMCVCTVAKSVERVWSHGSCCDAITHCLLAQNRTLTLPRPQQQLLTGSSYCNHSSHCERRLFEAALSIGWGEEGSSKYNLSFFFFEVRATCQLGR